MNNLSKTEKNVLLLFHLQGFGGKSGNLTKQQRLTLLQNLIQKGYMDNNCNLTKQGEKVCNDQHNKMYN